MPTILDTIVAHKRVELERDRRTVPLRDLQAQVRDLPATRPFADALRRRNGIHLIAEVKRASPSKGVIRADFDPVTIAGEYAAAGADAVSVLTDERFFQGSLDALRAVRLRVDRPLLRKDFALDAYHLYQARVAGADAVLLIVAILTDDTLRMLSETASALNLACLVEVHDEFELERALNAGARIVGVNNRDLKTFVTTLETTFRLRSQVPNGVLCVSESGIASREDAERLERAGVDAMLVGESLMRSGDIKGKVRELLGWSLN
jgi:indole-3-glycerol phosphate synthase